MPNRPNTPRTETGLDPILVIQLNRELHQLVFMDKEGLERYTSDEKMPVVLRQVAAQLLDEGKAQRTSMDLLRMLRPVEHTEEVDSLTERARTI